MPNHPRIRRTAMRLLTVLVRLCVATAVLEASSLVRAQEGGGPPIPKPTAEHKILTADEGTWDATIKGFGGAPGAEPTISKGLEVNTVMSGGLWLLSRFDGDFGGIKFEGRGQFGYDTLQKKYVGTWIDSLTPALSVLEGSYDARTRTMTYVGDGVDAATKSKFTQKMVTTTKDDGTRVFTLYVKSAETGDKEARIMEISYTKRK
jgi:Protein of unknown function (DUF1579)